MYSLNPICKRTFYGKANVLTQLTQEPISVLFKPVFCRSLDMLSNNTVVYFMVPIEQVPSIA